ncbi:MAG: RidA family protein [Phycisphaeraceae bacterium]|nr:RidA family protein [Phycisphaeraceae bacterium]
MTQREAVFPNNPHALYELHGYSPAIRSGDLLFVSGQVGCGVDGRPIEDLEQQIRRAFLNLASVLEASGCGFEDVVDVTSFHIDPERQLGLLLPIKDSYFAPAHRPNWTAVGVTWLAGFQFEIKVIARIPARD